MVDFRGKAALFRQNAEEIRTRISELIHDETKIVFQRLADDYDRLATTYEEMEKLSNSN
jgi:hypothetical protein